MKRYVLTILILVTIAWTIQAETLSAPGKRPVLLDELADQLSDLEGKVIRIEINEVADVKPTNPYWYTAWCGFYDDDWDGRAITLGFPPKGRVFFKELENHGWGRDYPVHSQSVYCLVEDTSDSLRVVGTRYRKKENKYSWRDSNETFPSPERGTMSLAKLIDQQSDLIGKVIKTKINSVADLKKANPSWYTGWCGFYDAEWVGSAITVGVPPEGTVLFEELKSRGWGKEFLGTDKVIYCLVEGEDAYLRALGTRYRTVANKYSW